MTQDEVLDIAIIGAGPAGMTAALYGARANRSVAMFERIAPGGQLAQTEHLENFPGYTSSTSGFDLAMAMHEQASSFGAKTIGEEVLSIDFDQKPFELTTAFGRYRANSIIIASGARPAKLGLEMEEELTGHGVSFCATCDGNFFRNKDVVVVGGGNTAAADTIYLSRICRSVRLVHRRDKLRATAIYTQRLLDLKNVEIGWNTTVERLIADDGRLAELELRNVVSGETEFVKADALFEAVGTIPNTEFLNGALELSPSGHIVAGELGQTSIPGVFAAGDVRQKSLAQVVTATSDGAVCAEEAVAYLDGVGLV